MLMRTSIAALIFMLGIVLLAVSLIGVLAPADDAATYQGVWRASDSSRSFTWSMHALDNIALAPFVPVTEQVMLIVNRRMANPSFRAGVRPTENWLLWALGLISPNFAGYTFADPRRALRRGLGDCYQQAITVVGLLEERGIES